REQPRVVGQAASDGKDHRPRAVCAGVRPRLFRRALHRTVGMAAHADARAPGLTHRPARRLRRRRYQRRLVPADLRSMMRRLLAALVVVAVAACGGPAADPAALYGGAREGMLRGELEAADALIEAALEADPDAALAAALQLLRAEIRLLERDIDGAGTIIDAPLPAIDATAAGRLEARRLYLDGYRLRARGAIAAGLTQLDASAVLARRWGATDVALDADVLAGQALYRLGRPDEADARLLAARTEAAASGLRARELAALGTLGMGQLVRERFDAALHWFEQAPSFTAFEDHLSYAAALLNAGVCHARLGNFTRALELQRRAVELHQSRQVTTYLEQALGELGHTLFLAGDAAAA